MRFSSLLTIFLLIGLGSARQRKGSSNGDQAQNQGIAETDRDGKLFSLFTIVNFKNDPCISSSSLSSGSTSYRNGTCYTSSECSNKGGSSKGNCASGFGVCCIFLYDTSSDTTINYNDTYIQNPSWPSTYGDTSSLTYTVNKCSDDICWLRLDFETFTNVGLSATDEGGAGGAASPTCTDTFTVSTGTSGTNNYPVICGDNTGQHIYVDIGNGASDTATLAFAFTGSSTARKWDIKVAQIPCSTTYTPTSGCLQYHTGVTGRIETFNFNTAAGSHLPNQDYAACVRQEEGRCCIEYTVCSDDNSFSLNNLIDISADATLGKSSTGTNCYPGTNTASDFTGDFIEIAGSGGSCGASSGSLYCGQALHVLNDQLVALQIPICDCTTPFAVNVVTDAYADANSDKSANRGVCLEYRQLPCGQSGT